MFNNAENVLALIKQSDRVLDIGGAVEVFPRANAVIDIVGYEERKPGQLQDMPECFSKSDWYVGDICSPKLWGQFRDKEFDFAICSHVLEDIRDPILVCQQMIRVAKAGYIECPSRFRECAKTKASDPVSGWEHHRWILDIEDDTLVFTGKMVWASQFDYLGETRRRYIYDYLPNFTAVHWIGSFDYVERSHKGSPVESENLFYFYEKYPYDNPNPFHTIDNIAHKGRTFEWYTQFSLPVEKEYSIEQILSKYQSRLASSTNSPRNSLYQVVGKLRRLMK